MTTQQYADAMLSLWRERRELFGKLISLCFTYQDAAISADAWFGAKALGLTLSFERSKEHVVETFC